MIKVHWWKGGPRHGNFGDELNKRLIEVLSGQEVVWSSAKDSDMLGIGSLLEPLFWDDGDADEYEGSVWGSGRMHGETEFALPRAQLYALRGSMTRETMGGRFGTISKKVPIGDPGLLANLLMPRRYKKDYVLGIIPHWSERDDTLPRIIADNSTPGTVRIIDICDSVDEVLAAIDRCQCVWSSSLHGLVAADALGVPNKWYVRNRGEAKLAGAPLWKFFDYYSALDQDKRPMEMEAHDTATYLRQWSDKSSPNIPKVQQTIAAAFPYPR